MGRGAVPACGSRASAGRTRGSRHARSPPCPVPPAQGSWPAALTGPGGRLPLHFNCPAAELLNQGPTANKTVRRVALPRPAGAAGARRGRPAWLLAPTLPGRWRQAPASHAAALSGQGPVRSGQIKREDNEASGHAGRVCSAPRWQCQRRLPRPGTHCGCPRVGQAALPTEAVGQCWSLADTAAPMCWGKLGRCDSRLLFWELSPCLLK